MTARLHNKITLVTGGSSGIGFATAKRFAQEGAFVYITGRRQEELDRAVKEIGSPSVKAVCSDNANLKDLDSLFDLIRRDKGRLDVFFANAGVGDFTPLEKVTEANFDRIFNTNVKGTLFAVQKAVPLMPPGSAIILNGSIVSIKGPPAFGVYSASKAALRSFARSWSSDLKEKKIRVNVVSPGYVVTAAYTRELGMNDAQIAETKEQIAKTAPLGRTGEPDEIAKAVVFLGSEDSSYITGVELFVDGGLVQV